MLALVVAYSENRIIGNKGKIPWYIKADLERFRDITMGNIIVMGRLTYESIGRPLPGRITIVVSTTALYEGENLYTVKSLDKAIELSDKINNENRTKMNIYISGGERLYREAIRLVSKMYVTVVDGEYEGDAKFPEFDTRDFECVIEKRLDDYNCTFMTYTRI